MRRTSRAVWTLVAAAGALAGACASDPATEVRGVVEQPPTTTGATASTTTTIGSTGSTTTVPVDVSGTSVENPSPAPTTTASEPPTGDGGCGASAQLPVGDTVLTIDVDGLAREFEVTVPSTYDHRAPAPLVLNLHARSSNRTQQRLYTGFDELAERDGWVLVHPQSLTPTADDRVQWNYGGLLDQTYSDDNFLIAALDEVSGSLCIDSSRVYATGMSSGGFMSTSLACTHPERFAAVAPVAGGAFVPGLCDDGPAVPQLRFHGVDDEIVPYENPAVPIADVETVTASWAARNGCGEEPDIEVFGATTETVWPCDEAAETRLLVAADAGHTWPGAVPLPVFGETNTDVSATELIWEFFARHQR